MLALPLSLALLAPAVQKAPIQAPVEGPAEVLADLIQRTNGLAAFRARYLAEVPGEGERRIEIVYLAPDRMLVQVIDGEKRMCVAQVGGRMEVLRSTGVKETECARVDWQALDERHAPAWAEALDRAFPPDREGWLGPGPNADLDWRFNEQEDQVDFSVKWGWSHARRVLLPWLEILERDLDHLALEEGLLVQTHERYRATVSPEHGFLTSLRVTSAEGETIRVRLAHLDLEPDLEAADFELDLSGATQDMSDQFAVPPELDEHLASSWHARNRVVRRIATHLAEGRAQWDHATRAKAEEILTAVHEPRVTKVARPYVESMHDHVRSLVDRLDELDGSGASWEVVQREVTALRAQLEEHASSGRGAWLDQIDADDPRLLALERHVVGSLYDQHLVRKLLADFDAQVEEALGV